MLPELFLERMEKMLGRDYEFFLASYGQERYQALRVNPLKISEKGETAGQALTAPGGPFHLEGVPWEKNGFYYAKEDQPGRHPYHEAGLYYIQEPSAMAPAPFLEVKPGERVLDLCAAPGGKSTQLAAYLEGRGLLVSNEIHPARAKILSENIERLGVSNACVMNETPERLAEAFPEYFDKILVDAPCSGEGMFRKSEEACAEWSLENIELCGKRQDGILDCAARMLRPGGHMVYSTCTFAPLENEGSVSRFLDRHPEFTIVPVDKGKYGFAAKTPVLPEKRAEGGLSVENVRGGCDGRPEWVERPAPGLEGTLRLFPHLVKGEGHYAALLEKEGQVPEGYHALPAGSVMRDFVREKDLGEFRDFCRENLRVEFKGNYIKFGDNLYLVPEEMPDLKGLRVLRPGLCMGTLKKNRFEPSHALALAIAPAEAAHVWHLSSSEALTEAYLRGQTFAAEGEKGWYLICVDGFGLGWGKLAGGVMKNHYPKGLRGK